MTNLSRALARLILLLIVVSFSGCKKSKANFTTDKELYYGTDTIHFTCTTENVRSVSWKFPDGTIAKGKTADYVLGSHDYQNILVYMNTRTKTGKNSAIKKEITVKSHSGTMTLWSTYPKGISIYATNLKSQNLNYLGKTTSVFKNDPGCGGVGALNVNLIVSTYYFAAYSSTGQLIWGDMIALNRNDCLSVQIKQ